MFFFLFEWKRFCLWEQLAGIADILSQAPCAMYTDNAVGNVVAETGRDGGTTTRLSDRSMPFPLCASPLKGEVQRSPEPSARPSAAADSEERQICTTCFFAESVGLCLCFLPSSAMYKDKAVGNVVAEMGRDLVFMTTARLSDLSMPLKGEVRRSTWTVCTAADCEERQICTTCLFAESIGLWKVDGLVCWSTRLFDLRGVIRGRGEIWHGSPQWNTKPPAKTTNSNSCDRAAAQVKEHKPEQPGWKYSKYWANIEKRNQINTKNYWK